MTSFSIIANSITILHTLLILGVLVGILISIRYKKFRPIESGILLVMILVWSLYGGCPLTNLENHFRLLSGTSIPLLEEGFIPYYVNSWFGIPISNHQLTIVTYSATLIFILISIEWLSAYINIHLVHVRKKIFLKKH